MRRYFKENKKYFKWYMNNKPKYEILNVETTLNGLIKVDFRPAN